MPIRIKKSFRASVLDIGCGCGNGLKVLKAIGFHDLTGVDLFSPLPGKYEGIKFIQGDIFQLTGKKYDLIILNHSFEHMEQPDKTMKKISELLQPGGVCILRIPVMGKYAWNKYKTCWYQIDAPRHLYLHTEKGIAYLAGKAGLEIKKVVYDSTAAQFLVSEKYASTHMGYVQICRQVSPKITKDNIRKAHFLNKMSEGDQAGFYMVKEILPRPKSVTHS